MKLYIATRFSNDTYRKMAIEMKERLEKLGHEMTFEWMTGESLKPYQKNPRETSKVAKIALDGARLSDFFILIAEPNGTGMYVEFGAALAQAENTNSPKIFVIGDEKYCSMFNFHPAVNFVDTLEEVIDSIS